MLESILLWLGETLAGNIWRRFFPRKDTEVEAHVSEKQLKIVSDRTSADAASSLHDGTF